QAKPRPLHRQCAAGQQDADGEARQVQSHQGLSIPEEARRRGSECAEDASDQRSGARSQELGGPMRKRMMFRLIGLAAAAGTSGALIAQTRLQPSDYRILSGSDIGFRVEGTDRS